MPCNLGKVFHSDLDAPDGLSVSKFLFEHLEENLWRIIILMVSLEIYFKMPLASAVH